MSINQPMFPISSYYVFVEFSSWVIILFVDMYHSVSTTISTASGYKCFKIVSHLCIILPSPETSMKYPRSRMWIKVLSLLLLLHYKGSFPGIRTPFFCYRRKHVLPYRRFLTHTKFSYCVIYCTQDTFTLFLWFTLQLYHSNTVLKPYSMWFYSNWSIEMSQRSLWGDDFYSFYIITKGYILFAWNFP